MTEARSVMRRWGLVSAVLVLAGVVRLYRLGDENLWLDEVVQVQVASQSLGEIVRNYDAGANPSRYQQAPLSLLVTHLFLSPSHTEWFVRLPAAVCGLVTVLALFLVGRELFPHPVPTLAALLLALSPLAVWYSQEARWYAQWMALTTLSYVALLRAWRGGHLRAWAAFAVLTLLSLYTFILTFAVLACQATSVWWLHRRREPAGRFAAPFIAALVAVGAAVLPVMWIAATYLRQQPEPARLTIAALPFTAFVYAAGFSLGPTLTDLHGAPPLRLIATEYTETLAVLALFLPLLVLGIRQAWRAPPAAAVLLPWLAGPVMLAFVLAVLTNISFRVRYTLVALPPFLLIIALGVSSVRGTGLRWLTCAAVLACSLWSLGNYFWNPRWDKEHVRDSLAHIRATGLTDSPVVVLGEIKPAVKYYARGLPVVPSRGCAENSAHGPVADEAELWVVAGRDWKAQAPPCLQRLSRSHGVVEHRRFPGVDLWLLRRWDRIGASRAAPAPNFDRLRPSAAAAYSGAES